MREIAVSLKKERNLNMQKKKDTHIAVGKTNKQNRRSKRAKHNRIKSLKKKKKKLEKYTFFFKLYSIATRIITITPQVAQCLLYFYAFSLFILMHGTPRWRKTGIMEKKFPFFFPFFRFLMEL